MKKIVSLIILIAFLLPFGHAQTVDELNIPDPKSAFIRSMALPGWGHYYVNKSDWTRGKYHLGADAILIISFLGFNIHSNNLQKNWFGYAQTEAGIDLKGRGRSLQLAVGDFNSLEAYNDFQARSRHWDQFIEDTPENRWSWQSDGKRNEYNDLRNRFENIDQQLPALVGLMVVNRVISAVSAYNRAVKRGKDSNATSLSLLPYNGMQGILAQFRIGF